MTYGRISKKQQEILDYMKMKSLTEEGFLLVDEMIIFY